MTVITPVPVNGFGDAPAFLSSQLIAPVSRFAVPWNSRPSGRVSERGGVSSGLDVIESFCHRVLVDELRQEKYLDLADSYGFTICKGLVGQFTRARLGRDRGPSERARSQKRSRWLARCAVIAILVVVCCAGPLLLVSLAATGAGAWLVAHGYPIGAAALLVLAALLAWRIRARLSRGAPEKARP